MYSSLLKLNKNLFVLIALYKIDNSSCKTVTFHNLQSDLA